MRVQFESSVNDMVALSLRQVACSQSLRSSQRSGNLFGMIIIAAGTIVGLSFILQGDQIEKIVFVCVFAFVGACLFSIINPWLIKRRLRRYYLEQFGTDEPITIEVDLSPEGLSVRQAGCRMIFDWITVNQVSETPELIELQTKRGGLVHVKKSAFDSESQLRQFLSEVEQFRQESQSA